MNRQKTVTRRGFLGGTAAFAALGARCATAGTTAQARQLDPEAIGFISDIHVGLPLARQQYKTMRDYPHQPAASQALVREILALPRLSGSTRESSRMKSACGVFTTETNRPGTFVVLS